MTTGWGAPQWMRPLSACLCAVDGMTVMHNLVCVENMLCSLSGSGCPITSILHLQQTFTGTAFLRSRLRILSFIFFFSPLSTLFANESLQDCCLFTPSPLFHPLFLLSWLGVQRLSRLRSPRLTTSRPLARINLSPLFLPVEQD